MFSEIFDVEKQLTFYLSYHSNKTNILVHMLCVPLLLWTGLIMGSESPLPSFVPPIYHEFNGYLIFNLNYPTIVAGLFFLYYLMLEPVAALLYSPQLALTVLTATAFSCHQRDAMVKAGILHGICWTAQILGHGIAEKRAPALLDNLLAAIILAPFIIHLEILSSMGYNPGLRKRVQNSVGVEIARIRREEAERKRAAGKRDL